jgi:alkylhydroperoxidase family enzyme
MAQRLDYKSIAAAGASALDRVHGYVGHSGLPKELIDLVYLRVSLINGCAYCIDLHTRDLRH